MLILVVLIVLLTNIAAAVSQHNGIPDILGLLFPRRTATEDMNAAEALQAPFAAAENAAQPDAVYDPLAGDIVLSRDLDRPHRNEASVNDWVTGAVSQALTFTLAGYAPLQHELSVFMTHNAMENYRTFLETTRILGVMQTRRLDLHAFVTDLPTLVAAGTAGGVYHWVYDVPVNLTFLPPGAVSYEDLDPGQYVSETLTLRLQIGRVAEGGREGIVIESWEARKKRPGGPR